jgi:SAM-dependent methyltransferase
MQRDILLQLAGQVDLGQEMVELGPGYGAATEWLSTRVRNLTAIEMDATTAESLKRRFADSNVKVLIGDATNTGLPAESVDSVASFTMLHHIPTGAGQFTLLAEAFRLLRPGGVLIGSDSLASSELHEFHASDVYNPIDPARLLIALQAIGFGPISIRVGHDVTFTAQKPESTERS